MKGVTHNLHHFRGKKKKNKSTSRQKSTRKERASNKGTHKNKYKKES